MSALFYCQGPGSTRVMKATPPLVVFAVTVKKIELPEAVRVQSSGVVCAKDVLSIEQTAGVENVLSLLKTVRLALLVRPLILTV